jgi:hypothetical protein
MLLIKKNSVTQILSYTKMRGQFEGHTVDYWISNIKSNKFYLKLARPKQHNTSFWTDIYKYYIKSYTNIYIQTQHIHVHKYQAYTIKLQSR